MLLRNEGSISPQLNNVAVYKYGSTDTKVWKLLSILTPIAFSRADKIASIAKLLILCYFVNINQVSFLNLRKIHTI